MGKRVMKKKKYSRTISYITPTVVSKFIVGFFQPVIDCDCIVPEKKNVFGESAYIYLSIYISIYDELMLNVLRCHVTNAEARFNKSHIRKVYACLAVTCHLHFWQNDRDFLRATVVTRGWNGYRNKSQHRKSTLEKKILPPFQQGFEPATFQSRVRCSNH